MNRSNILNSLLDVKLRELGGLGFFYPILFVSLTDNNIFLISENVYICEISEKTNEIGLPVVNN